MLWPRAAFGQHRDDVRKKLPRLPDKIGRKTAMLIGAYQPADENEVAARLDAVGITPRARPSGRI
jgi:hypothetical protein